MEEVISDLVHLNSDERVHVILTTKNSPRWTWRNSFHHHSSEDGLNSGRIAGVYIDSPH